MKEDSQLFAELEEDILYALNEDEALVDMLRQLPYGHMVSRRTFKRLKNSIYHEKIKCNRGDLYNYLPEVLSPDLLADNGTDTFIAMKPSGYVNMNPAFMILRCVDTNIYIVAIAKEGLISQHTVQKAVDDIKDIIKDIILSAFY